MTAEEMETLGLQVNAEAILLHPPLPLVGVSARMERGCQQNEPLGLQVKPKKGRAVLWCAT